MNFPDRLTLVTGQEETESPAYGLVVLISAKESEGVFTITDVSIRIPPGYPILATTDKVTVDGGPMAGTSSITQIRPNRNHTRYVATRVGGWSSAS